jgi:S-adenosyl methyltransferase
MSEDRSGPVLPEDYFRTPSPARTWNYWLGGKDNYPIDQEVGGVLVGAYPELPSMARQSRQFLVRAVRTLAGELGVRQFLDVGSGLPTMQNTHEIAQSITPAAKIVYVDNDPVVLTHARALLTSTTTEGATDYIDSDYRDTANVIAQARAVLNFDEPIAVMFMGVLGYLPDVTELYSVVGDFVNATTAGSYLAIWDFTLTSEAAYIVERKQKELGFPYYGRTVDELAHCFAELELVEPGLVPITQWRPALAEVGGTVQPVDAYGAVGRKR